MLNKKFAKNLGEENTCMKKCNECDFCPQHGSYKRFELDDGTVMIVYKVDKDCSSACGSNEQHEVPSSKDDD